MHAGQRDMTVKIKYKKMIIKNMEKKIRDKKYKPTRVSNYMPTIKFKGKKE